VLYLYAVFVYFLCVYMHVNFVFSLFFVLFSFVASFSTLILLVLGLLTCKNRLPYNLYLCWCRR